jgi:hypothetical protein
VITLEVVMLALKSWWREAIIVVLALTLWGAWSCKGAAVERVERKLERERVARQAAEETAASCDSALEIQTAAVKLHQELMVKDAAAVRAANIALADLHDRNQRELERRDQLESELRQSLAAVPEEDRCEEASRWAAARYREVTRAPH